jgi:hypothetical protein
MRFEIQICVKRKIFFCFPPFVHDIYTFICYNSKAFKSSASETVLAQASRAQIAPRRRKYSKNKGGTGYQSIPRVATTLICLEEATKDKAKF